MSIEKYFEREYNYLQQAGEAFSEKHPRLGAKLHLSERERKDPIVERLFEAFAFLTGRIHERLDDEIPEITGGLLEQLFPHFLRPFPSCAILEAEPVVGAVTKAVMVPKNSEIQTPTGRYKVKYAVSSSPLEKIRTLEKTEPAEFIFRTTQDLVVRPMRLKSVRVEDAPDSASALVLQIEPDRNITFDMLNLDRLTLYLNGAESLKYNLLLFLTNYVTAVYVAELKGENTDFKKIKDIKIGIPGLTSRLNHATEDFAIVPYARQAFKGYRLLHEYFAFPERFFFIDIEGLKQYPASREGYPFEIKFLFNRRLSGELRPTIKDILLHCSPIVNLFNRMTEEVIVTQRLPEYYIIPDLDRRKSREVYSINKVTGVNENKIEQYPYLPATSYDILDVNNTEYDFKRFYSIRRRPIKADMNEVFIRISGTSMEIADFPKETLSLEATLSNGFLPSNYLEAKSITEPINFPPGIKASNLTVPTEVLPNPDQQNFLWAFISHLTLNYSTLADADTLQQILSLYNWSQIFNNANKKRIEAIKKVEPPTAKNLFRQRGFIRGIEYKLEVAPEGFPNGTAEIHLFGLVLSQFLTQYVTINSQVILTIKESGTNKEYTWEPIQGKNLPV